MMILDDLQEIIDTSECPVSFPDEMNIGTEVLDDDFENAKIFEYFPEKSCDAFAHINEFKDNAYVKIHTHGVCVQIGDTKVNIHNSQLFLFDYWHFDDTVEYNRSDSRGSRVALGSMLGGPIVGAAIGLAASFGKGKKHVKRDNLVIGYWDAQSKTQQVINMQEPKDSEVGSVEKLVNCWKEQIKINKETGRKAVGSNMAGIDSSDGCLLLLLGGIVPILAAMYKLVEVFIC